MLKSPNNFLFVINIKCEPKEFENLLVKANIGYFDFKVEQVKYYNDDLTFCIFDSMLSRQEFIECINAFGEIKKVINEIQFCEREERK